MGKIMNVKSMIYLSLILNPNLTLKSNRKPSLNCVPTVIITLVSGAIFANLSYTYERILGVH